ncbi:DUF3575 domain-containing protein [Candidatus Symbiothrix dinenymphae]|uniref:DUF3575 domain-containing protein n=1 Tax=Candidatus Symbiothrix dinenymphae TaxID=467085 RepID=UPI0009E91172|nr:DUF3575 domain-containing protein [Candidatus Symbiothrix dinenymphae]
MVLVVWLLLAVGSAVAQRARPVLHNTAPTIAVSSNLLYDATSSVDVAVEYNLKHLNPLWKHTTLKLPVTYNAWGLWGNDKFRFLMVQPEFRKWVGEPYEGHFFGAHLIYARTNICGRGVSTRYEGDTFGLGVSYGYDFYLAPHWNLEANIGIGYAYSNYSQYGCRDCGDKIGSDHNNYLGPTQAGLSLIYIIK